MPRRLRSRNSVLNEVEPSGMRSKNCGVGGSFYLGASEKPQELILTLDADSYAKGIIGSGKTATVGGCYYWNGEE